MNNQEIFRKAADLLEGAGWIQGNFESCDGYCAVGAIGHVAGRFEARPACDSFREQLGEPIGLWNDHPKRTKEEVISMLRSLKEKP